MVEGAVHGCRKIIALNLIHFGYWDITTERTTHEIPEFVIECQAGEKIVFEVEKIIFELIPGDACVPASLLDRLPVCIYFCNL